VPGVLGSQWQWVIKPWDVVSHGDVDPSFVMAPVDGEATAEGAGPVDGEFVVCGFKCVNQTLGVGFGEALDAEVINVQHEGGAFGVMAPEARSEWRGFVRMELTS
jgi:hypothetical protein